MSDAPNELETRVMHIRKEPVAFAQATEWDRKLAAIPVAVDTCGDVYRGLARLSRSARRDPSAVLVCLHGVGPAELEFFSIMRRLRPDVGVFVYGDARLEDRIARAVELGATGRATDDVIEGLLTAKTTPRARVAAGPAATTPSRSSFPVPDAPAGEVASRESSPTAANETDNAADASQPSSRPARVPWLRYADAPARTSPGGNESAGAEVTPARQRDVRIAPDEPLLTEDELNALLEDDVAAIAPKPRGGRPSNEAGQDAGDA